MTVYNFQQLEKLWTDNGGNPAAAPTMAAIALAESGGDSGSLNNTPSTGDYSVGLWQINYYDGLYSGRTAAYGDPASLQADPNAQARAAKGVSGNGSDFTPWSTYKNKAYLKFLNGNSPLGSSSGLSSAQQASIASGGQTTPHVGCSGKGANGDGIIFHFPGFFGAGNFDVTYCQQKAILSFWTIGAGLILGTVGLILVVTQTRLGRKAVTGAASAVPTPAGEGVKYAAKQAEASKASEANRKAEVNAARRRLEARRRLNERAAERNPGRTSNGNGHEPRTPAAGRRSDEARMTAAGLSTPGPGDRRTKREKLRAGV